MNKQQLSILERAFCAEVEQGAFKQGTGILQTRSKVAAKLAEDGYLEWCTVTLNPYSRPVLIEGYRLTHLGRLTYCATCEGEE